MDTVEKFTSDRRLYLDKYGKVVEADDPTKLTLLVGEGGTIPMARAKELGLTEPVEAAPDEADGDEPKAKSAPAKAKGKK